MAYLTDITSIEKEAAPLREEMAVVNELIWQAVAQNTSIALNQEDSQQRYDSPAARYETAVTRIVAIEAECAAQKAQGHAIDIFLESLIDSNEIISEFLPELWNAMVGHATIAKQDHATFLSRNQMEIFSYSDQPASFIMTPKYTVELH